jgi:hypothetical protein
MNEQNIIIVIGDLGSGINLVKNTILLSPAVHWPYDSLNRFNYITTNAYPTLLKKSMENWITYEYRFRQSKKFYGVDIADNFADIATTEVIKISQTNKIVFITHWCDTANQLKNLYPGINIVTLYPNDDHELLWQIKTYVDKVGIGNIQNFSFFDDVKNQKYMYIDKFGIGSYYKFNISNMFHIMKNRVVDYKNISTNTIQIGKLPTGYWIEQLNDTLTLNLNTNEAKNMVSIWHNLHNNNSIYDYPWLDITLI